MKESIARSLQFVRRIAWVYKLSLSGVVLLGGSWLHFDDGVGTDSGAKAAALALCTGCVLVIDLLPNSDGPHGTLAALVTRVAGALLALGAGWHWISSETDGAQWLYMWPVFFFAAAVMVGLTYGLLGSMVTSRPRRAGREQFSSTILDALSEEYSRFRKALENEDTKHGELAGCIIAMETHLANLLLFLRSDAKSGLNQVELVDLLRYADIEFDDEPVGIAARSQHRRLRMIVRGAIGELSPDP